MNEYAITVFYLLEEAAKIDASERLDDIMVNSIPYMEEDDAKRVINNYETQAKDEIIDMDRDENAKDKLKQIFGG